MFFCVFLVSTTYISDSHINYLNNRFYSNLCNVVSTAENTQQNITFENLLHNDKMQAKDGVDSGHDQNSNKLNLDGGLTYDQHSCETDTLSLTSSNDLSQHKKITNSLDQDYSISDISANIPQYWNDVFNTTHVSYTNIVEKNLPLTNNNYFSAQANMYSNLNLSKQTESLPAVQLNEPLTKHLKANCNDNYTEFNNQNIDDLIFKNSLYIEIDNYINQEPSKYNDKKSSFQEFDFEHKNNNLVVSSFKNCDTDKYAEVNNKEVDEYSKINNKKSLDNDDLIINDTKEQEKRSEHFAVDNGPVQSFSFDNLSIELFNILTKYKKELGELKSKFFLDVRKKSCGDLIFCNLSKNSKYCNSRQRLNSNSSYFNALTNDTLVPLMIDINNLFLSATTEKLLCGWVEFIAEVAQFVANFKSYINLKNYNRCDIFSNFTLIETTTFEIILKFDFKKINFFLEYDTQNHENPMLSDPKVKKVLFQIFHNIWKFEEELGLCVFYIAKLKNFMKKL